METVDFNPVTAELGGIRITLRRDLQFSQRTLAGDRIYVVEDPATGHFFQLSLSEYTFISLLNGKRTLDQAVAKSSIVLGSSALSVEEAASLAYWLIENQLGQTDKTIAIERIRTQTARLDEATLLQQLNPLMLKWRFGCPDDRVAWLERYLGWLVSWPVFLLWLAGTLYSLTVLGQNWHRFTAGMSNVLTVHNGIYLAITWVILKSLHELGHAIVCKRWGGEVRECGVIFIVLMPLPYVDVTSAWRMGSKAQRILISAAGMMAELFLAAIAVIVWSRTGPGIVNQYAYNAIITAGAVTLIFNANPLMRFDGYYMLSDALDIPNLATRGQLFVRRVARRVFFGRRFHEQLELLSGRGLFIKMYGVAAAIWKVLISVSLTLGAAALWPGVGLAMATMGICFWFGIPLCRGVKYLACGSKVEQPNRLRFALTLGSLLAVLIAIGNLIPGPRTVSAPVVIEYDPLSVIRAKSPGFVAELLVSSGDRVRVGQTVVRLSNPELHARYAQIVSEVDRTNTSAKSFLRHEDVSSYQTAMKNLQALNQQRQQLEHDCEALTVVAEVDGVVLSNDLDARFGSFIQRGEEILTIGDPNAKKAVALFKQDDAKAVRDAQGKPAAVRIYGAWNSPRRGTISRVSPRAAVDPGNERFALVGGGSLPVIELNDPALVDSPRLQLVEPRVRTEISFDQATSLGVVAGEFGQVRLQSGDSTLGQHYWMQLSSWFSHRIRQNHGL